MKRFSGLLITLLLALAVLVTPALAADNVPSDLVPQNSNSRTATTSTTAVPTEAQAYAAMIAMKSQYPEGMPWTNDNYYGWKGGTFSGGYGCAGFTFLLSDAAFGDLPARTLYNITIGDVHVGDILRVNNDSHSVIVLEKYPSYVVLAEGNFNSSIHWGRKMGASEVAASTYLMTRYPVGTFGTAYTIHYDANGGEDGPEDEAYDAGFSVTLADRTPIRRFHKFLGWSTSPTATTATYQPGQTIKLTSDLTLYAVWAEADFGIISNTFPNVYNASITRANTEYPYKFTPSVTAEYTFEGLCEEEDPVLYLYDAAGKLLTWIDDYNGDANFKLTITLNANTTYIVSICFYDGGTGTIPMRVSREDPIKVTTHPAGVTADCGDNATFRIAATGTQLTYQWQYKMGNGAWTDTTLAGNNTAVLTVPATAARNGCQYRCVVKDSAGNVAYSNAATLTVKVALKITGHPGTKTVEAGKNAQFGVIADGIGLIYQWQYRFGNGAWTNTTLSGNKTSLLTVPATAARNGCQYRCVVKDSSGHTAYSNAATLTVKAPVKITGHPLSKSVTVNTNAQFGVIADGVGLTYQWQYRFGNGAWTNTTLSGNRTSLLTVPATTARNGCQYRCVVKDSGGNVAYSNAATLTVKVPTLKITGHPGTKTVEAGKNAQFGVIASGTGLTYQWQYRFGSGTWTNTTLSGNRTSLLTVPATTARNGCQYRCVVKDSGGNVAYSNAATLTVKIPPLKITGHPGTKSVEAGKNAQFGVIASGMGLTYQWQYRFGNGAWTNTTLSGNKTSLLTVPATTARNGCQYRCIVKDSAGSVAYSNPATLTVK